MSYRGPFDQFHGSLGPSEEPALGPRRLREQFGFAAGVEAGRIGPFNSQVQEAVEVLMVAEKPSIARAIVEALSGGKYQTRKGRPVISRRV